MYILFIYTLYVLIEVLIALQIDTSILMQNTEAKPSTILYQNKKNRNLNLYNISRTKINH